MLALLPCMPNVYLGKSKCWIRHKTNHFFFILQNSTTSTCLIVMLKYRSLGMFLILTFYKALALWPQNMSVSALMPWTLYSLSSRSIPASFLSYPFSILFMSEMSLNWRPFQFRSHPNYLTHFSAWIVLVTCRISMSLVFRMSAMTFSLPLGSSSTQSTMFFWKVTGDDI